ncbi:MULTISPECIES: phage baseplate assembly protein V [unclassified Campylobacter]|uniref:phage baseplate assembly protein V n=1 Tax=unclassified Campylobacter TaxID=2593542 RepID=UPI003D348C99
MIKLGNICEVASGKALVKVNYQGTITKLIPYISPANSFMQSYTPPRVGEQVILLECESGNAKFALGAIFCQSYKEPSGSSNTKQITAYEDGTIISYDSSSSTLEILNPKMINIKAKNSVNITTPVLNLNGDLVVSGNITDSRGDLTGHSHSDTDGYTSTPR